LKLFIGNQVDDVLGILLVAEGDIAALVSFGVSGLASIEMILSALPLHDFFGLSDRESLGGGLMVLYLRHILNIKFRLFA